MKKKKITFFLPSLEPGGTERNVVNLVNSINREIYEVSLALGKKEGDFLKQLRSDIAIIDLDSHHSLGLFFKFKTYFKNQKPDIFVSAFPRINVICIAAKIFSGAKAKIVITEHSVFSLLPVIAKTPLRRLFARFCMPALVKFLYPKADAAICVSRGISEDLLRSVDISSKTKIIYNPVIDDGIYRLAQEAVDHPWFSDRQTPIILAAGRLVACKDYPTLLRACKLVFERKSARLVVLGRGPEEAYLKNMANELGISDRVAFLGFQENPFKYMAKANIFSLSSLQEGFGNVIIEAMACGVPVVSTDCPAGPAEIIEHGKNGFLVPVGDEKAMADSIADILDNPELAEKFRHEGKIRAEFFSVKKSVEEYENVFKQLSFQ